MSLRWSRYYNVSASGFLEILQKIFLMVLHAQWCGKIFRSRTYHSVIRLWRVKTGNITSTLTLWRRVSHCSVIHVSKELTFDHGAIECLFDSATDINMHVVYNIHSLKYRNKRFKLNDRSRWNISWYLSGQRVVPKWQDELSHNNYKVAASEVQERK